MKPVSTAVALLSLIPLLAPTASTIHAMPLQGTTSAPQQTIKKARPAISVLAVSALDEQGKSNVTSVGQGDALLFSRAEEAITKSGAFRLFGRDQWKNQTDEINMNNEGWVTPESAKQFGKAQGIDRFVVVFVSGGGANSYSTKTVDESEVPADGQIIKGSGDSYAKNYTSSNTLIGILTGGGSSTNNKQKSRRLSEATITITCRFTAVETGERITQSFTGTARGDASKVARTSVMDAALQDAFDSFTKSLRDSRELISGTVKEIQENMLIIELGQKDGIEKGMLFEVCEPKKIGSFVSTSMNKICDARVLEVNEQMALLEVGEFKSVFLKGTEFRRKDDKAKSVQPGFVVRERKQ